MSDSLNAQELKRRIDELNQKQIEMLSVLIEMVEKDEDGLSKLIEVMEHFYDTPDTTAKDTESDTPDTTAKDTESVAQVLRSLRDASKTRYETDVFEISEQELKDVVE